MKPMSTTSPTGATGTAAELRKNVMVGGKRRLGRWLWRGVALLVVAGIVVGVIAWRKNGAATATRYDTKPVTQGDLKATVSATGTLSGRDTVEIGAGRGAVIGPYEKFCFDIDDAFDQIVVRLDRRRVESACAAMLGSDRTRPVHFELALHRMPQTWGNLLEAAANLATLDSALAHPRLHAQLEDMIVTSLLLSQPNSWSAAISGYGSAAPHAQVRRAMDYMRDHIDAPLRLGDIAKDCGMSLRSLQAGFQRDLGISPGRWLRAQRLERAHDTLLAAIPGSTTVTEVALRWGFPHLGEFAARYSARFGEKPSETLARLPH